MKVPNALVAAVVATTATLAPRAASAEGRGHSAPLPAAARVERGSPTPGADVVRAPTVLGDAWARTLQAVRRWTNARRPKHLSRSADHRPELLPKNGRVV
jgi:hypothetical protein